jgi:hypothetical protein
MILKAFYSNLCYLDCPVWLPILGFHILAALPIMCRVQVVLSFLTYTVLSVLSLLSCPGRHVLAVMSWLSNPSCPVLAVLSWLSCLDRPVLFVLFCQSCPGLPVLVSFSCISALTVVLCLPCSGSLFWVSCSGYPASAVLF